MRRWITLILATLLLGGCTAGHTEASPIPGGERVGPEGNLWYLPHKTVEQMEVRQLLGTGDGLLLRSADGGLTLLSQEDLSVRAGISLELSDRAVVQTLDGGIGAADPAQGRVTLLNADLTVYGVYEREPAQELWLLSRDGSICCTFSGQEIRAEELPNGQSQQLLSARQLYPALVAGDRFILGAVGVTDLATRWYGLALSAQTLTELDAFGTAAMEQGLLPLDRDCWLSIDGRKLTMYDGEGRFLSACTLSGGRRDHCGTDFVWSERWQGWFFLDHYRDECRLMFWDPAVRVEPSSDLPRETVPAGTLLEQRLYDRAAELSERFGLDIRIAEQTVRDYKSYTAEVLADQQMTDRALDVLEDALAAYPEGFFRQLPFSDVRTIRIEIVDGLRPVSGADVSASELAFSHQRKGYYLLVLNGSDMREGVIYHEISHVIDKRLAWDASLRTEALFSEERWLELQPEGFDYAGSYQDIPDSVKEFYDSGYFVQDYACVSPSEDRALTLEKAMLGDRAVFEENPRLLPKLAYYCACIRDSFDDTGWPETVVWEQLLGQAAE